MSGNISTFKSTAYLFALSKTRKKLTQLRLDRLSREPTKQPQR